MDFHSTLSIYSSIYGYRKLFKFSFLVYVFFWIPGCAHFPCYLQHWGTFHIVWHVQHFGAGTFHFACYAQQFKARTVHFGCYLQHFIVGTILSHAIRSILELKPSVSLASCKIWQLEPCNLLASWICAYIATYWSCKLPFGMLFPSCCCLFVVGCGLLSVSCGFFFVALEAA